MAKTLAQMRSLVQTKLANVGSGTSVLWQPAEIDEVINEAILHIGYVGDISLVQPSLYLANNSIAITSGLATKPTSYFRYVYGRVDSYRAIPIPPDEIDKALYDYYAQGGTKNKYIVNYSGTQFQIYPNTASLLELHYIAELTEMSSDSDTSPLTKVGDRYAVDWAYALCLESKGRSPEISLPIFTRVTGIIQAQKSFDFMGQTGAVAGIGAAPPGSTA